MTGLVHMRTRVEKSLNFFRVHENQQENVRDVANTWLTILNVVSPTDCNEMLIRSKVTVWSAIMLQKVIW